MSRQMQCPLSGGRSLEIPEGLYTVKDRPGHWQYSFPVTKSELSKGKTRGKKKRLFTIIPNEYQSKYPTGLIPLKDAIQWTEVLNKEFRPELLEVKIKPTNKTGFIPYEVDKFMQGWAQRHHAKHKNVYELDSDGNKVLLKSGADKGKPKMTNNWSRKFRYAKWFKEAYPNTLLIDLDRGDFQEWFYDGLGSFDDNGDELSVYPSSLLNKAAEVLRKFLRNRHEENCFHCSNALEPDSVAEYMAVKKRERLTQEQFDAIRKLAVEAGDFMVVNALDIGYQTLLRVSNVIKLRFDYVEGLAEGINSKNELYLKPVKKKTNIRTVIDLNLPQAKPLVKIIKQCETTRNIATFKNKAEGPCPFIVHHDFTTYKECGKEHPMEITAGYMAERFRLYRDQLPCFEGANRKTLPTFHEIRALGAYNELLRTEDKEWVSKLLGHDDIKTTEQFYLNGHGNDIVIQKLFLPEAA